MAEEFFTDGFANIAVTGSVVRIDLMSITGMDANNKPRFEVKSRMLMPLDGFLRSYLMSEDIVNKLTKAGVINKRNPAAPTIQAQASGDPAASPAKKK